MLRANFPVLDWPRKPALPVRLYLMGIAVGMIAGLAMGLFSPLRAYAQAENAAAASPVPTVHVVQADETLRTIAESYGTTWQDVAAINRLENPNILEVGQVLRIFGEIPSDFVADYLRPDYDFSDMPVYTATVDSALGNAAPPVLPGTYVATDEVYSVQAGDTLGQIATAYGVPLSALIQVNNIENPTYIYVGQTIVIAAPAVPPAPAAPIAEGKVILVSVSQQYLWAYENGQVVVESFVTTGRPRADTPLGTWAVLVKYTDYQFVSPYPEGHEFYYNSQMSNYSLRYTWDGYHIHDAPWRSDYGPGTNVPHQDSLGRTQTGSIGCTNVTAAAMAQLYEWAEVGTPVVVVE
ncbi:MAG: LysM peptidoglycan-binding domain-containing protein [Litorilinea sp.]